jgi:hypothetical protein
MIPEAEACAKGLGLVSPEAHERVERACREYAARVVEEEAARHERIVNSIEESYGKPPGAVVTCPRDEIRRLRTLARRIRNGGV